VDPELQAALGPAARILLAVVPVLLLVGGLGITVAAAGSPAIRQALWPAGPRPAPPAASIAGAAAAVFLPAYLFVCTARVQLLPALDSYRVPGSSLMTQNLLLLAVTAAVWGGRLSPGQARSALGLARPRARHLLSGLLGFAAVMWMTALANLAAGWTYRLLAGRPAPPQRILELLPYIDPGPRVLMAGISVLIAPLAEELFFRGLLFGALRARYGFWTAGLLSSALFAAVHLSAVHVLPLTVLGMALCWLYERTGSLWSSVAMHALNNAFVLAVVFFGLSGARG
jgi:membrane protease YdiL (CAAX protease family)